MKALVAVLLTLGSVFGQEEETITAGLLRSQSDLSLGHEFFETNVIISRETLSSFIYSDTRAFINAHMDAFGDIKVTMIETTEALDEIVITPENEACVDGIKNRWEIQIHRFGHRLSDCLKTANRSNFGSYQISF